MRLKILRTFFIAAIFLLTGLMTGNIGADPVITSEFDWSNGYIGDRTLSTSRITPIRFDSVGVSQIDQIEMDFRINADKDNIKFRAIPEPLAMFLLGTALIGIAGLQRRYRKD